MTKRKQLSHLSPVQKAIYDQMKPGKRYTAYGLHASIATLYALQREGLVESFHGLGSIFSPRVCIEWRKR